MSREGIPLLQDVALPPPPPRGSTPPYPGIGKIAAHSRCQPGSGDWGCEFRDYGLGLRVLEFRAWRMLLRLLSSPYPGIGRRAAHSRCQPGLADWGCEFRDDGVGLRAWSSELSAWVSGLRV